jgi:hypothetical protein
MSNYEYNAWVGDTYPREGISNEVSSDNDPSFAVPFIFHTNFLQIQCTIGRGNE